MYIYLSISSRKRGLSPPPLDRLFHVDESATLSAFKDLCPEGLPARHSRTGTVETMAGFGSNFATGMVPDAAPVKKRGRPCKKPHKDMSAANNGRLRANPPKGDRKGPACFLCLKSKTDMVGDVGHYDADGCICRTVMCYECAQLGAVRNQVGDENQALCCATCRRPVTAMRRVGRDGRTLTVEAIPLTALRLTATVRLYAEEEKHQKWAHAFLNRR